MQVGIQARTLRGRRTGINNYCFNLVAALARLDPELRFLDAGVLGWREIRSEEFSAKADAASEQVGSPSAVSRIRNGVKKIELAQTLHHRVQRAMLGRVYKSRAIELFHAFNYVPPAPPAAPTLPVVYDLSFIRYPQMHPDERLRRLSGLDRILDGSRLVHTISEFSKREISEVYGIPPERIFVAYPAAASHFHRRGFDATLGDLQTLDLTADRYLLAVGTLEPRKNLKTLIAAYATLSPPDRRRYPLVIVGGEGWGETDFPSNTDSLVSEGSLRFVGFASDSVLRSLYEGTRLMLYPSIYEGFGMPVVEAMACGASVAHSSNTSMDEITDGRAMLVSALDVDGWTKCIRDAIAGFEKTSKHDLVEQASRFRWDDGARLVRAAYDQVALKA